MFHVVIYWPDGITMYIGSFDTVKEALACASSYQQIDCGGKITMAKF